MQVPKSVSESEKIGSEIVVSEVEKSDQSRDLGFVYFFAMENTSLIKIGFTGTSLCRRYESVRRGSPAELIPLGYFRASRRHEKELHRKFSKSRTKGEWFNDDGTIMEFMEQSTIPFSDLSECHAPVNLIRDEYNAVCEELSRWIESWSYRSREGERTMTFDERQMLPKIRMRHPVVIPLLSA